MEAGGIVPARHIPLTGFATSCDSRFLPKASIHRDSSLVSSREISAHSRNTTAPFPPDPLSLNVALFVVLCSRFRKSCTGFVPRWAWRARESLDWTRGITFSHIPSTLRLIPLTSISPPDGLSCQRTPPLLSPFGAPSSLFRISPSPPPASSSSCLDQQGSYPSPFRVIFHRQGCRRSPACSSCLSVTSVTTFFSFSRSADARGHSGYRSRRDGRIPWAEAAASRPKTKAWQPMDAPSFIALLLLYKYVCGGGHYVRSRFGTNRVYMVANPACQGQLKRDSGPVRA